MNKSDHHSGFTLIELVLVTLLLGILAAVAIPNFIDFRSDAKNAATQGALAGFRSAVSIAMAAIALKEDPTQNNFSKYPTITEMWLNTFLTVSPSSHAVLASTNTNIMDPAQGYPKNPWTATTSPINTFNSIYDCTANSRAQLNASVGNAGWCYNGGSTGQIWANSALNGASAAQTENSY